jgi:hypothetical protein
LGAALVIIGAVGVAVYSLLNRTKELTVQQRLNAELQQRVAQATSDTVTNVRLLASVLQDSNQKYEDRQKALAKLIEINPEFANTLKLEKDGHLQGAEAIGIYIQNLTKKAEAEVRYQLFLEKTKRKQELLNKFKSTDDGKGLTDEQIFQRLNTIKKVTGSLGGELGELLTVDQEVKSLSTNLAEIAKTALDAGNSITTNVIPPVKVVGVSINNLKEKLKGLQEQRDAATDDKTRASLNKQIAETEKAIDKLEGKTTKLSATEKKAANSTKELEEELRRIRLSILPDDNDAQKFTKQIAELDEKYAKLREKAGSNNALLLEIEKTYQLERDSIEDKWRKEFLERASKYNEEQLKKEQKSAKDKVDVWATSLSAVAKVSASALQLAAVLNREEIAKAELDVIKKKGKEKLEAELRLLDLQKKSELSNKDLTETEKLLIEEKYRKKRKDAELQHFVGLLGEIAKWAEKVSNVFNIISDIRTNKENAELARDKANSDKKKKNLDNLLKHGLVSQLEYDRQIQKLEKQQELREKAARLKQFKRDQRAQIVSAGINGLKAVTTTMAEFGPPIPPNFLGIAAMALTLLTTGLTLKAIASKEPPSFGRGGKTSGPSHAQGGMGVYDHQGRKQAELEGGEGIMNKFSMRDRTRYTVSGTPSQIASALNARHGGVHWESGAVLTPSWRSMKPVPMNFSAIHRAYAEGGVFSRDGQAIPIVSRDGQAIPIVSRDGQAIPIVSRNESADALNMISNTLANLTNSVNSLNAQLEKGIIAKTYITDQEAQQDRLNDIRNDATFQA